MNQSPFTVAMVVPTGIGAKIGGHAGDATCASRLLAAACDTLIVHPNVVNAADLNEMPANALYVEGSMLDRFLRGEIGLQPTRSNRIVIAANAPLRPETLNCAAAARSLLGADVRVVELLEPLLMTSVIADGIAGGHVEGVLAACQQLLREDCDAFAVHTPVAVNEESALKYLRTLSGPNPWGGVEALVSREMSLALNKPVAHAPVDSNPSFNEVVPEPLAPELISVSMLFSVLKGLHRAPRVAWLGDWRALQFHDVSVLVTADCWGPPHEACMRAGIPIIRVLENATVQPAGNRLELIDAATYLEAAGMLLAMRTGLDRFWRGGGGT